MFNVASGILQLMKGRFDAFAHALELIVENCRILDSLGVTFGVPHAVLPGFKDAGLPSVAQKAFIGTHVAVADMTQDGFRGSALSGVRQNQVVNQWQAG